MNGYSVLMHHVRSRKPLKGSLRGVSPFETPTDTSHLERLINYFSVICLSVSVIGVIIYLIRSDDPGRNLRTQNPSPGVTVRYSPIEMLHQRRLQQM